MWRGALKTIVAATVGLVVAGGVYLYWAWHHPLAPGSEEYLVKPGTPLRALARELTGRGVLPEPYSLLALAHLRGQSRLLKAGEYRFDRAATAFQVVDRLARGDVFVRAITFPEGRTAAEMAAIFEERGFGAAAAFRAAARETSLVRAFDPSASDLEGYLFPSTYRLPRSATARALVGLMVQSFESSFDAGLRAAAAARGFTVREAVTMASLVEEEAQKPEERPLISAVYHNRLKIGMGLQCDATVIYALQRAGRWNGNITRADLAMDSPYNTYRYRGLPPGPIANPGRASLEAAVTPADVPYLYYVSRNDGSHAFATTLDEHNRNVQEYQIQYFRDRR